MSKEFWDNRWQTGQTGWDLNGVSPAIQKYIDTITDKNIQILIPGCGNAYEVDYLLQEGFNHIHVIDISPTLTNKLKDKYKSAVSAGNLKIFCGDFFTHKGKYDLIIEQTFFCAISPALRRDYAKQMKNLLAPNGKLVGLLFNTDFDGGPPFGGNIYEYNEYFKHYFNTIYFTPCADSIAPRAGKEVWITIKD